MKLFDSHCHLDDRSFGRDIDDVILRSRKAGVEALMIVGISEASSERVVALAEGNPGFYASVGIHPHLAKECNEDVISFLRNLSKNPKVRAWGEIGLDFNRMFSPKNIQEKWLLRQLDTSDELELPVIFHERDSKGRFLEILKAHFKEGKKGVIHCFSGNKPEMFQYLDLGLSIGITGILTQKERGKKLRELVSHIPLDRILVETDAPYLTPAPEKNRTRRNEPAFVKSVLLKLAEVRNEEPGFLCTKIWENTCRVFDIPIGSD